MFFRRTVEGARALAHRVAVGLLRLAGWSYVAAGSLIGFEGLELLLGFQALYPVALPLTIAGLAVIWLFRERIRDGVRRARIRHRAAHVARARRRDHRRTEGLGGAHLPQWLTASWMRKALRNPAPTRSHTGTRGGSGTTPPYHPTDRPIILEEDRLQPHA